MRLQTYLTEKLNAHSGNWFFCAWVPWAVVVSILITGYDGLHGSTLCYSMPLVHRLHKPESYPTDVFVDATSNYPTAYWYVVTILARFIDMERLLFWLFILSRVSYILSVYFLAKSLFPEDKRVNLLAIAVAATVPTPPVGEGGFVQSFAEQTVFAFACSLCFFAQLFLKQWARSAIFLGLAINLNLMYALFDIIYALVVIFLHPKYRFYKHSFFLMLFSSFVIGIPGIWLASSAVIQASATEVDNRLVWQVAALAFPHHFFMESYPYYRHFLFLSFALLTLFTGVWLIKKREVVGHTVVLFTLTALGWYLLAWTNPLFIHSLPLLHLQPVRGHQLWFLLSLIVACFVCVKYIAEINMQNARSVVSGYVVVSLIILTHVILSGSLRRLMLFLVCAVFTGVLAWISFSCMHCNTLLEKIRLRLSVTEDRFVFRAILILTFIFISNTAIFRYTLLSAFKNARKFDYETVESVSHWARQHTSPDSMFLIPVVSISADSRTPPSYWDSFRHLSERGVFVTWSDGVAWSYAPWYASTWLERIRDIGCLNSVQAHNPSEIAANYRQTIRAVANVYLTLSDEKVSQLSQKYGIDYWITHSDTPSRFREIYRVGHWKVLQLAQEGQRR
jgi:hypothetical protein